MQSTITFMKTIYPARSPQSIVLLENESHHVNHTHEPQSKRAKIEQPHKEDRGMDYSTKIMTNLSNMDSRASKEEMMDSLLFDCEVKLH